jgi:hypothetical protein
MTLLRWIHLRKLVPLSELIHGLEKAGPKPVAGSTPPLRVTPPVSRPAPPSPSTRSTADSAPPPRAATPRESGGRLTETSASLPAVEPVPAERLKDAFLEEVRKVKKFFYGTVIAQAQRIDVDGDRIVVTFGPQHRPMKAQLEQTRPWLETIASQLAGRKMTVAAVESTAAIAAAREREGNAAGSETTAKQAALREKALADSGVQAMLDVFAADIKDIEEM